MPNHFIPRVTLPCAVCGEPVTREQRSLREHPQACCSRVCAGKLSGPQNLKDGRYVRDGYVMLNMPDHPEAVNGVVREHRIVMERIIGRPLLPREVVHHLNHDKADNRPENLELMAWGEHTRHHCEGERSSSAKLTESDVLAIREAVTNGATQKSQSEKYGLSKAHLSGIIHRRYWRHV